MMMSIWTKWHHQPVIVSFNDKTTPISVIPFPAVTICTTKKFNKGQIDPEYFEKILGDLIDDPMAYKKLSNEEYQIHFL